MLICLPMDVTHDVYEFHASDEGQSEHHSSITIAVRQPAEPGCLERHRRLARCER